MKIASYYLGHLFLLYRIHIMAQCKICGKRYWFFSQHKCEIKSRHSNSTQTRSNDFYRSITSNANEQIQQQQLIQQTIILTSSNDDTCRSTSIEVTGSHPSDSITLTSSNHCHSSHDSGSSSSSDSSSSSYDSGSSSGSSWD